MERPGSAGSARIVIGFAGTWNSGSATSARIYIVNTTTSVVGNEFSLDDIVLTPSPGAVGILVVASGIFSLRRRR